MIPELNTGGASLITSLVNPAVGLGSFVAQRPVSGQRSVTYY